MIDVDRAAMTLMDKMSTDGHEVNYIQCREYATLAIAAAMLAEFTEEGTRWCSCADAPWSSRCSDDCVEGRPRVRFVGPWEPEPRHIDQGEHHD